MPVLIAQQGQIWWGYGALVAAIAIAGAAIAIALWLRPTTTVVYAAIAGTVTSTLLYVISRTVGFPFGPGPSPSLTFTDPLHGPGHAKYAEYSGRAESVGLLDLGCLVAEIALVVLLVSMLPDRPAAVRHERPLCRGCGTLGVQMDRNPRLIRRIVLPVALVVLVAGVLFALQPIRVHADSMRPTLHSGDEIVIDRLSLVLRDPHRGELVVANSPSGGLVVKRVAALGGDSIGIEDGVLVVNGKQQREGYVDYASVDGFYFGPVDVPKGEVFLLGDNRANSEDSRDFGPVPEDEVVGRVLLRVWPLTR